MHTTETDQCPDHSDGHHRYGPSGGCMGTTCKAQSTLRPCRSPYCECEPGKCTHPGFRDARHEITEIADEESRIRALFEATAKDSFNFRRSRRGTYVNPAIARDWKWFYLGAMKGNALTQRPAAQDGGKCAMRYTPIWKPGTDDLPYQESNFACQACKYVGKHDTHPGCKRPAAHQTTKDSRR